MPRPDDIAELNITKVHPKLPPTRTNGELSQDQQANSSETTDQMGRIQ